MPRHAFRGAVVALILALAAVLAPVAAAPAAAAACPTGWGSLPEVSPPLGPAPIVDVRAGTQPCYDRVVFDIAGPAAGYSVSYVDVVGAEGSGAPLYVPGGARLAVVLHHPAGPLPYGVNQRAADVGGFPVLRSVTYGGSFEGYTTFGVGVRARLPFRVFTLTGPGGHSRIVLDVARGW